MLRLRLSVPGDLTAPLVESLASDPAVSSLAVFEGASLLPDGDVVEANVAREAANDLVERIHEIGVHRVGCVELESVETWFSRAGHEADEATPGSSADAVVWATVTQQAYEESEFNWTFGSFMVLATVLAAIAIVLDSQVLVIGAMVLGPEFGAIAALGVGLVRRRTHLFGRAAATLAGGFAVAIGITCLVTLGARALGWVSVTDITGPRPQTGFIYTPDKWSFIVAIIAAAAGVLSLTSARVGGLSGVFISVTTIPAAANVSMGLAFGVWHEVVGSSLQLALNLSGMAVAGWLTLAFQQLVWSAVSARRARLVARLRRGGRSDG